MKANCVVYRGGSMNGAMFDSQPSRATAWHSISTASVGEFWISILETNHYILLPKPKLYQGKMRHIYQYSGSSFTLDNPVALQELKELAEKQNANS